MIITLKYIEHKQIFYDNIDIRLKDAANTGDYLIGKKLHNLSFDKTLVSKEQNKKNSLLLSTLTNDSDITYVYTLVKNNNKAYFSCTSVTNEEQKNNEYSPYLLEYDEATKKLLKAFDNHKYYYGEVSESYGKFRSIIMPKQSSDGSWYIIGADIKIDHIDQELNKMIIDYFGVFIAFMIILLPFFLKFRILEKDGIKEELQNQKNLLEQNKLAQMGEMIGNIAHQWRQPLSEINSIVMNIDDKNIDNSVDKIETITEYMSETINNFNNFFRIDKQKEIYSIMEVISISLNICHNILNKHNIKIDTNTNEDIKYNGYKGELSQVIIALIKNASDAIAKNKIENPKIDIRAKSIDNKIIIDIQDNANGIDEDIIDNIFDPYFTTKFKSEGTGIGLYMSKVIIEKNMNGKLSVSNNSNGAIFRIEL